MSKKKVYYAHNMGLYNTAQEERDIYALEKMGFEVVNPNTPAISDEFKSATTVLSYKDAFVSVFGGAISECDVFAFRALPDGRIPSGVYWEMELALEEGQAIIELPHSPASRKMNPEQTREYLREIGQR